jgi:hypothetical protein
VARSRRILRGNHTILDRYAWGNFVNDFIIDIVLITNSNNASS